MHEPLKVELVQNWLVPTSVKQLWTFLRRLGYYKCFVKSYASIAHPFTKLLKKDSFKWSDEAVNAFEQLRIALVSPPILVLPGFTKQFVLETDALSTGMGAVFL